MTSDSASALPLPIGSAVPAPRRPAAASLARVFVAATMLAWTSALVVDFRIPLTVLTLAAFLAAILGIWRPVLGLFGLGMLCTLDGMSTPLLLHGGLWRWNTLNYWLLGVTLLSAPILLRRRDARVRALLLLLGCLGFGLLWTPDMAGGVQHIFGAMAMLGMVMYFLRAARSRDAWFWLAIVSSVTAVTAVLAFLLQESRLPYLNENIWSHAPLVAVFSTCLAFAARPLSRRRQLLLAGLAAANAGMVFLSGSRGNLAMALLGLLAIALMTPSLSQNLTVLIATVLLGIGVTSQFPALQARTIGRLALLADRDETARRRTSGRFQLALGGWYIFREHAPLGAGTGAFPAEWAGLGRREGLSAFKVGIPMSAHAGWVKVLAENGIPGVLLLTVFVSSFAVSGWRQTGRRRRVLGLLVTGTLAVGLLATQFQSKSLWYLAAGATVILSQRQQPRRQRLSVRQYRQRRARAGGTG